MNKTTIGITGSSGFIGSHLVDRLRREEGVELAPYQKSYFTDRSRLQEFVKRCAVLVHLAGMNRGEPKTIYEVNIRLVNDLIACLEEIQATPHVIFSSSTQSDQDNPYGRSKKEGCQLLETWALRQGAPLSILTIPNVFGDRCKPFYNSVVATFCYQLTHGEQPKILVDNEIELIYINELTEKISALIQNPPQGVEHVRIPGTVKITVSKLLTILEGFQEAYFTRKIVPKLTSPFLAQLYNVFLSYIDYKHYRQTPVLHIDPRGKLFEILKLEQGGQVFFSTTTPGIVRGNHYHTRKIERFCVLQGNAVIRLRRIGTEHVVEYSIADNEPAWIEIPIFHTHHIENIGHEDLYTLFWCNELFDPEDADTFFEKV
jgi:UDP-2-acetamido-2,6-beta-L-arabino-hexul-4-ose reductase